MAALPQCFSYHCCIESLGKLPPKGFGQHTVNVSAILRILLCLAARAVGSTWATGAAASTQGGAATAATGLRRERGATAGGAVRASLADAVRLGGPVAVAVPHGIPGVLPPTARALGLVAGSCRLLLGSIYKV